MALNIEGIVCQSKRVRSPRFLETQAGCKINASVRAQALSRAQLKAAGAAMAKKYGDGGYEF